MGAHMCARNTVGLKAKGVLEMSNAPRMTITVLMCSRPATSCGAGTLGWDIRSALFVSAAVFSVIGLFAQVGPARRCL